MIYTIIMKPNYVLAVVVVLFVLFIFTNLRNDPHPEIFAVDPHLKLSEIRGLVVSSAGIRGYSLLGAIEELVDSGLQLSEVSWFAGTSAGSLTCALLACRIPFDKIKEFIMNFNVSMITSSDSASHGLVKDGGLYDGDVMEKIIDKFIQKHTGAAGMTLSQVYKKYNSEVIMTAMNLKSPLQPYYFTRKTHANMPIARAARISSTVPLLFTPVSIDGAILIDGGLIDHYPIKKLQKASGLPLAKIIGVSINYDIRTNREVAKKTMHVLGLTITSLENRLKSNKLTKAEKQHTIHVETYTKKDHSSFNFHISPTSKQELFDIGKQSTRKFLLGSEHHA